MKWKAFIFFVLLPLVLIACQANKENEAMNHNQDNALIEVTFGTNPDENLTQNEPVEIYVKVTQDGKPVDDADDVAFEIWHEDDEAAEASHDHDGDGEHGGKADDTDHEANHDDHHQNGDDSHDEAAADGHDQDGQDDGGMYRKGTEVIPAEHKGDGVYSIEQTFGQEGVHFVMYHVTARNYHAMKAEEIHVQ